jgi:transcriptional regulator CtsR
MKTVDRGRLNLSKRMQDSAYRIDQFLDDSNFIGYHRVWCIQLDGDCIDKDQFQRVLTSFWRVMKRRFGATAIYTIESSSGGGGTLHIHGFIRFSSEAMRLLGSIADYYNSTVSEKMQKQVSDIMREESLKEWISACRRYSVPCRQNAESCLTLPKDRRGEKMRDYMLKTRKGRIFVKGHGVVIKKVNWKCPSNRKGLPSRSHSEKWYIERWSPEWDSLLEGGKG